jgi:fructose-1,6-bisphosphatase/inositol monophosphatase family enzyme
MLSSSSVEKLFEVELLAVQQAGAMARRLQGHVANEGKSAEAMPGDSAALKLKRAAKSAVDDAAQECLLLAALSTVDVAHLSVDAEEKTESVHHFAVNSDCTLVVDPVDGTLEYLMGLDSYSVCVGLVQEGHVSFAIVHFPKRGQTFCLGPDRQPYLTTWTPDVLSGSRRLLSIDRSVRTNTIYKNSRVPESANSALRALGFAVVDDTQDAIGCPDAILMILSGRSCAYIAHTRQMRDVLLGPIVAAVDGAYATDWNGAPLVWPQGGRVPRAIFGVGTPSEIVPCLRGRS